MVKTRKGARPRTIPKNEKERMRRLKLMRKIQSPSAFEIYKFRWLNPWYLLGDLICIFVMINLILSILIGLSYSIIAVVIDLIIIPIQLLSFFIFAPKWRDKNKKQLMKIVKERIKKEMEKVK